MVADMPRLSSTGLRTSPRARSKMVVLHVARADLEDVDVAAHHLNLRRVHHFADGEELKFFGGFVHQLQAFFAHALEGVR